MKKIPTLFNRVFKNREIISIEPSVCSGMEWVLSGDGIATIKLDGACCAIIDGVLYKRYDAKNGKQPPQNAIPCCDPDPITGHWPHWLPVDFDKPENKWFVAAYNNTTNKKDGTYEAVGPHFQGNPYELNTDRLEPHGTLVVDVPRDFLGIWDWLATHNVEGLVFWRDGQPQCKIKRTDFGLEWPEKEIRL